jgi:two-component system, OmpR family, sensor histidine kinase BaeS
VIRKPRVRFFLIVYPFVVAAILLMAFAFSRWTRVSVEELRRVDDQVVYIDVMRDSAQRTIRWSVVLASLVTAAVLLVLATPVMASSTRLAEWLDRSEKSKRRMVSDAAHELRTPLTNIIGLLDAMRDGLRMPDKQTLDSAREEAELLKSLIDELQELSVADAGALKLEIETFDVVAAARNAVAVMNQRGGVSVDVANHEPVLVRADQRRMAQVLRNLLHNALTHTADGGTVRVEVERRTRDVAIRIADTGSGITPEHLPHIWDRFYRVDASRNRATGGMGLGLAVVKELVDRMNGSVAVNSEAGRGSVFTITLPRG